MSDGDGSTGDELLIYYDDGANQVVELGATDNAVLDAMVVDLAAIEVLLTGMDADTNAIKGSTDSIDTGVQLSVTDLAALEVLSTAANALLTTIDADTGASAILLGALVTDLAAIEVLLGTIDSDTDAIKTAVEIIDNAISGSEMQVDIVSAPTITVDGTVTADLSATDNAVLDAIDTVLDTIKVDTEAIETAVEAIQVDADAIETLLTAANVDHAANEALLITIDADTNAIKTAVEIIDNAIDGSEMQVDIVSSATITVDGTVTANLGSTDNAVLDAMVVDLAAIEVLLTAANVDHAAIEVLLGTIDSDTNDIKVDMAAIEVLLTAIDSDTDAIKTAVQILDNAISGSEMQVDVVAALPAGSNAIGKLAANSGVDIGDVDVTSTVQPVGHGTVSHVAQNVTDSAVQLGSNACKHVDIMATIANTGIVYIGASGVSATTGIGLYPGDVYSVDITNTNLLYTISTVSGDDINMVIYS